VKTVCQVLGVARSNVHARAHRPVAWTDRRCGRRPRDDAELLAELRAVIDPLPSYGYRRAGELLNRQRRRCGRPVVNHKRLYRVMREAGWLLARHTGRPIDSRAHDGKIAVEESNRRWCSDGFEIGCDNAERVRVAFALDCCDREAMSWVATTAGIDGDLVRDLMVEAVEARFGAALPATPIEWLSDNGSPYVARDTRRFAKELNLVPLTTAIASPQSNGMAESFVKTFRRDYVARMDCADAMAVLRQLPAAFQHYNTVHPHSALKMLAPRMFRAKQAQLSNTPCPEI
jgi:transposase InsO family protein